MKKAWSIAVIKATGNIDIRIFDEIGAWGYTAADFQRDLTAAGSGKINLRINSPGGDVFQGFAIYNILNRIRDRVTVTVEGLAASMGSVIAMAGSKIIMPENAMMMIHDPAGMAAGGPEEMASFADALDKMRDSIVKAYTDRTKMPEDKIRQMMAKETWLSADEAVNMGFADQIEKPIQMAAHAGFDLKCYRNVPQSFGTQTEVKIMNEEIKRLCALFGKADLAQGFIDDKKSLADVLTALETAKAADEKKAKDAAEAAAATARAAEGKPPTTDEIRATLVAEMEEIRALCTLAGLPTKADEYIAAKKTAKEVVALLAAVQAKAAEGSGRKKAAAGTEVSPHHVPRHQGEGDAVALNPSAVWDKYNSAGKKK